MKKNKTILVSMSGGVKSLVAAYILKKQGDTVIGAYIQIPSLDGESYSMRPTCHQNDEDLVEKYCDQLGIAYLKIDGADYYNELVVKKLIAARLAGETFVPCVYCNQVRADLLIRKANELKIDFVATGHLAQVSKSTTTESYIISKAQDLKNDQSYFLTGLENLNLERMLFPLGKLVLAEILKIGKSLIGKKAEGSAKQICLTDEGFLATYIESQVPENLRRRGNIIEYFDDLPLGEHDGIHKYRLGQKHMRASFSDIDPSYEIIAIEPNKKIVFVAKNWKHELKFIRLKNFVPYLNLDCSRPIRCQVALDPSDTLEPGMLFFNNNNGAHVEFEKNLEKPLERGMHIVFYQHNKVIGSGTVEETHKKAPALSEIFQL